MGISRYVQVFCNKCGDETAPCEAGPRIARAEAKKAGWQLGKSKDFCPSCAKEISEAVSRAKAGEI